MNYCDEIWWIVDVFGLTDILETYFMKSGYEVTVGKRDGTPGLIFYKGHWKYKSKSGEIYDSYVMKYQIKGTAHFCQSFALLQYLKDIMPDKFRRFSDELRPDKYADNIRVVLSMWLYIFKEQPALLKRYVQEVKALHTVTDENNKLIYPEIYYSHAIDMTLDKMTNKKFIEMIKFIDEHAQKIVGCREG